MSAIEATAGLNSDEWEWLSASLKTYAPLSKAVAFVGAGFSRPDLPDWRGLLDALQKDMLAKNARAAERMGNLSAKGKFLEAAEIYEQKASVYDLANVLRRELGPAQYRTIPDERHKLLVKIPWRAILTTNLDTVLESSQLLAGEWEVLVAGRRATPALWQDVITRSGRYCLKLHGSLTADSAVLSATAFKTLMESQHYHAFLQAIFAGHHVVFMGYSITDPEIRGILSRLKKLFRGELPYSIMLTPSATEKQLGTMRARYNVRVAQYGESARHEGLRNFLRRLYEDLDSRRSTLPASSPSMLAEVMSQIVPNVPTPRTDLPRLSVLDGVLWNRLDELLRLREERRDLIRRGGYYAALQAVLQAVVCADAVGFNAQMHGLSDDHTVHALSRVAGATVVVPMRSTSAPLTTFVAEPWVRAILRERLGELRDTPELRSLYKPLVLRDAEEYFGNHPSLDDPAAGDSTYVFGKEYIADDELSATIADQFSELWLQPIGVVTGGRGSVQSRRSFVRRLMVTHFAIGLQYGKGLQPSSTLVIPETTEVIQTPTRMGAEPARLDNMGAELGPALGRHAVPVLIAHILTTAHCEPSKVLGAMAAERDTPFARYVRALLAQIAQSMRRQQLQEVQAWAKDLRAFIAAEATMQTAAVQLTKLVALGPEVSSYQRVLGDPSRFATPAIDQLAQDLWRRTFLTS